MSKSIEPASPAEAAMVTHVLQRSFAEYRDLYTPEAYRATVPAPSEIVARMEEGPVWIATINGRPAGTVAALITGEGCYLRGMGVTPEARGSGIGRLLIDTVEDHARTQTQSCIWLYTTPFLRGAIRLYKRAGFAFTPDQDGELHGTRLLAMQKVLDERR